MLYFHSGVTAGGFRMKFHMRKINSDNVFMSSANYQQISAKLVKLEFFPIKDENHVIWKNISQHVNWKPVSQ